MLGFNTQEARSGESRKRAIAYAKISHLLTTRKFHSWFLCNDSRLGCCNEVVHERLRADLYYSMISLIDRESRTKPPKARLKLIADAFKDTSIEFEARVTGNIFLKEKVFSFKNNSVSKDILDFFKEIDFTGSDYTIPDSYLRDFMLWLKHYAAARLTISEDTANSQFEDMLKELTPEYLISGYPYDILCHDANVIREKPESVVMIARTKAYCSSYMKQNLGNQDFDFDSNDRIVTHFKNPKYQQKISRKPAQRLNQRLA